jgi:hypothetical protein
MSTSITVLSGGYMEIACVDPWLSVMRRRYVIRRTVDYSRVVWC